MYLEPADAWGLKVWREQPSAQILARSLAQYDDFYAALRRLLVEVEEELGNFVLYDLHSYNFRRHEHGDPAANSEVNVGTGSLPKDRWGHVAARFIADLRDHAFPGRPVSGGLGSARTHGGVDFAPVIIDALDRKVRHARTGDHGLSNAQLATH